MLQMGHSKGHKVKFCTAIVASPKQFTAGQCCETTEQLITYPQSFSLIQQHAENANWPSTHVPHPVNPPASTGWLMW